MKKILLLATHNPHKVHEFRTAFHDMDIEIVSLDDLGITDDIEETGTSFTENALLKARALVGRSPYPIIADDSGLSITALNDFPGIYSSRFMENHPYSEKCASIIERLSNYDDRRAHFTCVIAYIDGHSEHCFQGECHGIITIEMHGYQGFGYDPIFFVPSLGKTYAELSEDEKNAISHRGHAISLLKEYLRNNK